jgi:hypothetical protein
MSTATEQELGPTGKSKNCSTWADYEEKGSSRAAALCHGGMYDGDYYHPCRSRYDCQAATVREKTEDNRHRLRVVPERPDASRIGRILGSTPAAAAPRDPREYVRRAFDPVTKALDTVPTTHKTLQSTPHSYDSRGVPVIPPEHYPAPMQTPYISPHPHAGYMTPTFLPDSAEEIFPRLASNILQGFVGAMGWQILDYARHVDLFRR